MAIKLLFHSATFTGSPRSLMVASRTSLLALIRLDHPRRPCALWLRNRRAAVSDVTTEAHLLFASIYCYTPSDTKTLNLSKL